MQYEINPDVLNKIADQFIARNPEAFQIGYILGSNEANTIHIEDLIISNKLSHWKNEPLEDQQIIGLAAYNGLLSPFNSEAAAHILESLLPVNIPPLIIITNYEKLHYILYL